MVKLAITPEQVAQFDPPPNPAKMTDSRAAAYVSKHGFSSYEADALPPAFLAQVVRDALESRIEWDAWGAVGEQEERDKALLSEASGQVMRRRRNGTG